MGVPVLEKRRLSQTLAHHLERQPRSGSWRGEEAITAEFLPPPWHSPDHSVLSWLNCHSWLRYSWASRYFKRDESILPTRQRTLSSEL